MKSRSILFQYKQILENHCFVINNSYYFFLEEGGMKLAKNDAFGNKEQKEIVLKHEQE